MYARLAISVAYENADSGVFRFFDLTTLVMSKLRFCLERIDVLLFASGLAALAWGFYPLIR